MTTVTEYFLLALVSFMVGYIMIKSRDLFIMAFVLLSSLSSAYTSHLLKTISGTIDSFSYIATIVILVVLGMIIGSRSPDHWEFNNTQTIPTEQVTEVTEVPKN